MSETRKETLRRLFTENNLVAEDVYKHQHYTIITRQGIDKIQANSSISINYDVVECSPNFCVVKATATSTDGKKTIQTFGSALKGQGFKDGNCNTWYVMEMSEKRAMSRAVLKLAGFYELGIFGEDESEDFKKS
jgi:hypothetical protein|tara:strand:+ start:27 stop:428 length:402 start_codon:yes stop_codon:yes gene_type:complete